MWQRLIIWLFSGASVSYWLLGLTGLLLLNQVSSCQERKAEPLRWAARRTVLLDSVHRAYEAQQLARRLLRDSTLTTRYHHQAAAAAQQHQQDEKLEKRYRATSVHLPAQ